MPWLTDLATVARRTGYPVIERAGWKTRGRAAMSGVRSVMCHHTAGGRNGNAPSLGVVQNGRAGLPGPLAQFVLGRDGTIYVVAAGRANHAGKVSATKYTNSYSIGIEAENTGVGEPWGDAQMDAYAKLCRELCDHYGIPYSDVVGHKEAAVPRGRKIDPTFNMNDFRKMVRARKGTGSSGGGSSPTKYTVVGPTEPLGLYDKDGGGRTRVLDWQTNALGYTGKNAEGVFGPDTDRDTRALQRQLGVKDDGLVGTDTVTAWENAGKPKLGKSAPSKPSPKPAPKIPQITVDGKWGSATTRRVQALLGTPVDGVVSFQPNAYKSQNPGLMSGWEWTSQPRSSNVIEALQKRLGVSADGRIGPNTIRALQRKLGTPVDGRVSNPSVMVRKLQENLNAGRLW